MFFCTKTGVLCLGSNQGDICSLRFLGLLLGRQVVFWIGIIPIKVFFGQGTQIQASFESPLKSRCAPAKGDLA